MLVYAIVYYAAPNVEVPRFQFITPGAVIGVVAWIVASAGFFFYVSNFSSYSATYGAFAGVVILLVWLWLTNVVLLLGAELNAVIDLRRAPELPAPLRRAAAAGEGPGGRLGARGSRSVISSGHEHSAARPGQSPQSARWGSAATGWRPSSTPSARLVRRSASAGTSRVGEASR